MEEGDGEVGESAAVKADGEHAMQYVRLIYIAASLVMLFGFFATISSFLIRLEMYHRERWYLFGSPKVIPASPFALFRLLKYIVVGEYRTLGDGVLNARALWVRLDLVAFVLLYLFPYAFHFAFGYAPY